MHRSCEQGKHALQSLFTLFAASMHHLLTLRSFLLTIFIPSMHQESGVLHPPTAWLSLYPCTVGIASSRHKKNGVVPRGHWAQLKSEPQGTGMPQDNPTFLARQQSETARTLLHAIALRFFAFFPHHAPWPRRGNL